MSRTGIIPIDIPKGIEVSVNDLNLIVKSQTGEQKLNFSKDLSVSIENKQILVKAKTVNKKTKMIWGTTRSLINNIIIGISNDYKKKLELNGTGYKAVQQGKSLKLNVGYSHEIDFNIPEGINNKCPNPNTIEISGANKEQVGQVTSELRSFRKPEPYKGTGIKEETEIIHRKEGKKK